MYRKMPGTTTTIYRRDDLSIAVFRYKPNIGSTIMANDLPLTKVIGRCMRIFLSGEVQRGEQLRYGRFCKGD